MSFFEHCSGCDAKVTTLHYKPDKSLDEQDDPSICIHCLEHRESVMMEGAA